MRWRHGMLGKKPASIVSALSIIFSPCTSSGGSSGFFLWRRPDPFRPKGRLRSALGTRDCVRAAFCASTGWWQSTLLEN
jgi:hypothetical protein